MSVIMDALIGTMILNHDKQDPEWRFQAGYLAEMLESGGKMPKGKALGGICRIAGKRITHKQALIQWARSVEQSFN